MSFLECIQLLVGFEGWGSHFGWGSPFLRPHIGSPARLAGDVVDTARRPGYVLASFPESGAPPKGDLTNGWFDLTVCVAGEPGHFVRVVVGCWWSGKVAIGIKLICSGPGLILFYTMHFGRKCAEL